MRLAVLAALALIGFGAMPAAAYQAPGPRWPGHTIRYSETLPPRFDWSLKQAVKSWNQAGVNLKFRKSARPQVRISLHDANGYGAYASIGRQPGAYVHVSPQYRRLQRRDHQMMARLLAHELGHVLGLNHVSPGRCKLMEAVLSNRCPQPAVQWQYFCRWVSKDDVKGAIRLYGGKPRRTPTFCTYEPAPPQLVNVRFSGGDSTTSPLTVSWDVPEGLSPGAKVAIEVYEGSRCTGQADAQFEGSDFVPARKKSWTDMFSADQPGTYCYEVQVQGAWGRGAAKIQHLVTRLAPPVPAPVVHSLTEYPDDMYDYAADVTLAPGAQLHVDVAPAGACPTQYVSEGYNHAERLGDERWGISGVPEGPACLAFFAMDDLGSASPPVTQEVVHGPRP